jgi:hypothetical protein
LGPSAYDYVILLGKNDLADIMNNLEMERFSALYKWVQSKSQRSLEEGISTLRVLREVKKMKKQGREENAKVEAEIGVIL